MSRVYTNKLYDMIAEGLLTHEAVMDMALSWLSEADVEEMYKHNNLDEYDYDLSDDE